MTKRKLTVSIALVALAVGALVAIQSFTGSGLITVVDAAPPPGGGGSGCEGDVKNEGAGPVTFPAPDGQSIASICIKAGRNVFTALCGEDDDGEAGCYDVSWTLGSDDCCTSVTIGGGGTSSTCQGISHTAVSFDGEPCDGCVPSDEKCTGGEDEDCDGLIDCEDPDCASNPVCVCVPSDEKCAGGEDEDCDGLIDCDDPDCKGNINC
jgi:hypothetical protein